MAPNGWKLCSDVPFSQSKTADKTKTKQMEAQAALFRAQKPFEDVDPSWTLMKGMTLPPPFKTIHAHPQGPVFTHMNDNNFPNLYRDDRFALYLNVASPFTELYPGKEERAGMSFVHLLAVPLERIYNYKSALPTDYGLISHMYETVNKLMNTPSFKDELAYQLTCQYVPLLETQELRIQFLRDMKTLHDDTSSRDMTYCFHPDPLHSVGHLHMHCVAKNMLTKSYMLNSHKNIPIDLVLQEILRLKQ